VFSWPKFLGGGKNFGVLAFCELNSQSTLARNFGDLFNAAWFAPI
jgi:hypothetical protein